MQLDTNESGTHYYVAGIKTQDIGLRRKNLFKNKRLDHLCEKFRRLYEKCREN